MYTANEEISARITLLQEVCGIIVANQLAQCTPDGAARFKVKLLSHMHNLRPPPYSTDTAGEQAEAAILERTVELTKEFIEIVSRQESEIRDLKKLMQPGSSAAADGPQH